MHLVIAIWAVLTVWIKKDYRSWEKYHATMLYMPCMNLLYLFLAREKYLWVVHSAIGFSQATVALIYTFIIFPATVLLFLKNFPSTPFSAVLHICKWVAIYAAIEWAGGLFGQITYQGGWNLGWSILFLFVMFPMLRLHEKRPLLAYGLSILIIIFLLHRFHVPWNAPL